MNKKAWGELYRGQWLLPGDWQGISGWVVSNCIVPHFFSVFFYHHYFFPYFSVLLKKYLSQPMSFMFFPILSPIPFGGGSERTAVWCLAACQVKPQQFYNRAKTEHKISFYTEL